MVSSFPSGVQRNCNKYGDLMSYYYEFSPYGTLCTFDGHSHSHFHGQGIDDGDGHPFPFWNSKKLYKYGDFTSYYYDCSMSF